MYLTLDLFRSRFGFLPMHEGSVATRIGGRMLVSRETRFVFEDGSDVEFIRGGRRIYTVWVNGVKIETLAEGEKPSRIRALYYYETYVDVLPELIAFHPMKAPSTFPAQVVIH